MCRIRGAAKNKPITVTDVQSDGRPFALPRDSYRAPHVCAAVAAACRVREIRDDRPLLQQWIDNNMSYLDLDARALVVLQSGDAVFRRDTWSVYHDLHMCRLGVCPCLYSIPLPSIVCNDVWACGRGRVAAVYSLLALSTSFCSLSLCANSVSVSVRRAACCGSGSGSVCVCEL
eukprot:scaffold5362_cov100-Isochrysis_galbana.AAC.5